MDTKDKEQTKDSQDNREGEQSKILQNSEFTPKISKLKNKEKDKEEDEKVYGVNQDNNQSLDEDEFIKFTLKPHSLTDDEEFAKQDLEAKKYKAKLENIERSKISEDAIDFYDTIVMKLYKSDENQFYRLCDEDSSWQLYWVDESKQHSDRNFHAYKMKVKPRISIHEINTKDNYFYLPGDPNFVKFDPNDYDEVVEIEKKNYKISKDAEKLPVLLYQPFYMESESTRNFMPKNLSSVDGEDETSVFPQWFTPLELSIRQADMLDDEAPEYIEQHAQYKVFTTVNGKVYYIDIDKENKLFLNSKENNNYIVLEIDRKRYENVPQEIKNEFTYMLCFDSRYYLKTSYDYHQLHYFDLESYPDFVMHPFDSVDEVGVNQCFRVVYYPSSDKMLIQCVCGHVVNDIRDSDCFLSYDPEKVKLALSKSPYFFDVEVLNSKDEPFTECTKFRIKVEKYKYLACRVDNEGSNSSYANLVVTEFKQKAQEEYNFTLLVNHQIRKMTLNYVQLRCALLFHNMPAITRDDHYTGYGNFEFAVEDLGYEIRLYGCNDTNMIKIYRSDLTERAYVYQGKLNTQKIKILVNSNNYLFVRKVFKHWRDKFSSEAKAIPSKLDQTMYNIQELTTCSYMILVEWREDSCEWLKKAGKVLKDYHCQDMHEYMKLFLQLSRLVKDVNEFESALHSQQNSYFVNTISPFINKIYENEETKGDLHLLFNAMTNDYKHHTAAWSGNYLSPKLIQYIGGLVMIDLKVPDDSKVQELYETYIQKKKEMTDEFNSKENVNLWVFDGRNKLSIRTQLENLVLSNILKLMISFQAMDINELKQAYKTNKIEEYVDFYLSKGAEDDLHFLGLIAKMHTICHYGCELGTLKNIVKKSFEIIGTIEDIDQLDNICFISETFNFVSTLLLNPDTSYYIVEEVMNASFHAVISKLFENFTYIKLYSKPDSIGFLKDLHLVNNQLITRQEAMDNNSYFEKDVIIDQFKLDTMMSIFKMMSLVIDCELVKQHDDPCKMDSLSRNALIKLTESTYVTLTHWVELPHSEFLSELVKYELGDEKLEDFMIKLQKLIVLWCDFTYEKDLSLLMVEILFKLNYMRQRENIRTTEFDMQEYARNGKTGILELCNKCLPFFYFIEVKYGNQYESLKKEIENLAQIIVKYTHDLRAKANNVDEFRKSQHSLLNDHSLFHYISLLYKVNKLGSYDPLNFTFDKIEGYVSKCYRFISKVYYLLLEACKHNSEVCHSLWKFDANFLKIRWKNKLCNDLHIDLITTMVHNLRSRALSSDCITQFSNFHANIGDLIPEGDKNRIITKTHTLDELKLFSIDRNVVPNTKKLVDHLTQVMNEEGELNVKTEENGETYELSKTEINAQRHLFINSCDDLYSQDFLKIITQSLVNKGPIDDKNKDLRLLLLFTKRCFDCLDQVAPSLQSQHILYYMINNLIEIADIAENIDTDEIAKVFCNDTFVSSIFKVLSNNHRFTQNVGQLRAACYRFLAKVVKLDSDRARKSLIKWFYVQTNSRQSFSHIHRMMFVSSICINSGISVPDYAELTSFLDFLQPLIRMDATWQNHIRSQQFCSLSYNLVLELANLLQSCAPNLSTPNLHSMFIKVLNAIVSSVEGGNGDNEQVYAKAGVYQTLLDVIEQGGEAKQQCLDAMRVMLNYANRK